MKMTEPQPVPIDQVTPHPQNPRVGDVAAIALSIEENGFYGTILAQQSTGYILVGNHRYKAAVEVGLTEVPVSYVDCDDQQALEILVADNRPADTATYDFKSLASLLSRHLDGDGLRGTGYSGKEAQKIISSLTPGEEKVIENKSDKPINVVLRFGKYTCDVKADDLFEWIDDIRLEYGFKPATVRRVIAEKLGVSQ